MGARGTNGYQGSAGYQGSRGIEGYRGSVGYRGSGGAKGLQISFPSTIIYGQPFDFYITGAQPNEYYDLYITGNNMPWLNTSLTFQPVDSDGNVTKLNNTFFDYRYVGKLSLRFNFSSGAVVKLSTTVINNVDVIFPATVVQNQTFSWSIINGKPADKFFYVVENMNGTQIARVPEAAVNFWNPTPLDSSGNFIGTDFFDATFPIAPYKVKFYFQSEREFSFSGIPDNLHTRTVSVIGDGPRGYTGSRAYTGSSGAFAARGYTGSPGTGGTGSGGTGFTGSAGTNGSSNMRVFTFTGNTQLFNIPAGVTRIKVTVVGGGGGGGLGANYGGGGGGGTAIKIISNLTPGELILIAVGRGGTAGSSGGTSSFGSYCSATGGGNGLANQGGVGGQGSGGDLMFNGSGGGGGGLLSTIAYAINGHGGSSFYGGGGRGGVNEPASAGGGGGGGGGANQSGSNGVVVVEW